MLVVEQADGRVLLLLEQGSTPEQTFDEMRLHLPAGAQLRGVIDASEVPPVRWQSAWRWREREQRLVVDLGEARRCKQREIARVARRIAHCLLPGPARTELEQLAEHDPQLGILISLDELDAYVPAALTLRGLDWIEPETSAF